MIVGLWETMECGRWKMGKSYKARRLGCLEAEKMHSLLAYWEDALPGKCTNQLPAVSDED